MKDLDLIKQLGEDLAPRQDEPLAGLPAATFRDSPPKRPVKIWHAGMVGLALMGAAAAVAIVWPSPQTSPESTAIDPAAVILNNAAAVSSQSTLLTFQGGEYIFTETVSSYPSQVEQPDGSFKIVRDSPVVTQIWLPVNPAKSGQQRQRPREGSAEWGPWLPVAPCLEAQKSTVPERAPSTCVRGLLPEDFPTEPAAVLAWLKGDRPDGSPSPTTSSGGTIEGQDALALETARTLLVTGTYLLPEQRGAIFKALARIPEVDTMANVQDGSGRKGVGISAGGFEALVFDSSSYEFLGTTSSAVMKQATTTEVGRLPS
ncbi:CU044_5270 family protein [Micromonospora sp. WMMD987]|uniref:CU044_5270 family protein n=1 Tax=Micromonospora sp. WMMD987 TaxID=3016089 RepID=UPI002499CE8B|nr:CU044_5270 family protein [Micromonospora sp. WMMD987]WFE95789.1 CU044_5270 family protein [Micromonospora sp. WMMD987]